MRAGLSQPEGPVQARRDAHHGHDQAAFFGYQDFPGGDHLSQVREDVIARPRRRAT